MKQLLILALVTTSALAVSQNQRTRRDAAAEPEPNPKPDPKPTPDAKPDSKPDESGVYYKQHQGSSSSQSSSSYIPAGYPVPKKKQPYVQPPQRHHQGETYYEPEYQPRKREIAGHGKAPPKHHSQPSYGYGYEPEPHYGPPPSRHHGGYSTYTELQEELLYLKEQQRKLKARQIALQEKALRQLEAATEALRLAEHAVREDQEQDEEPAVQILPSPAQTQFRVVALPQTQTLATTNILGTNTVAGLGTGLGAGLGAGAAAGGIGGLGAGAINAAAATGQNVQLTLSNGQTVTLPAAALQTAQIGN